MEICYDGALVMPSSYAAMDEEEITYVEAGYKVAYNTGFRSKLGCVGYATALVNSHKVKNISIYDVAAEIYTHAFGYYQGGLFLAIATKIGMKQAASIFKSLNDGIDIDNGVDTKTLCKGVKRYQLYRALYAAGPGVF